MVTSANVCYCPFAKQATFLNLFIEVQSSRCLLPFQCPSTSAHFKEAFKVLLGLLLLLLLLSRSLPTLHFVITRYSQVAPVASALMWIIASGKSLQPFPMRTTFVLSRLYTIRGNRVKRQHSGPEFNSTCRGSKTQNVKMLFKRHYQTLSYLI